MLTINDYRDRHTDAITYITGRHSTDGIKVFQTDVDKGCDNAANNRRLKMPQRETHSDATEIVVYLKYVRLFTGLIQLSVSLVNDDDDPSNMTLGSHQRIVHRITTSDAGLADAATDRWLDQV